VKFGDEDDDEKKEEEKLKSRFAPLVGYLKKELAEFVDKGAPPRSRFSLRLPLANLSSRDSHDFDSLDHVALSCHGRHVRLLGQHGAPSRGAEPGQRQLHAQLCEDAEEGMPRLLSSSGAHSG
jgi:hypothetical protein